MIPVRIAAFLVGLAFVSATAALVTNAIPGTAGIMVCVGISAYGIAVAFIQAAVKP